MAINLDPKDKPRWAYDRNILTGEDRVAVEFSKHMVMMSYDPAYPEILRIRVSRTDPQTGGRVEIMDTTFGMEALDSGGRPPPFIV